MSVTEPEAAFTFLSQGALIQEFKVAGHNIVQSLPEARSNDEPGERSHTREPLNGQNYKLAVNDGDNPNSLHGGFQGWGKQDFEGPRPVNRNGREGVQFRYLSRDGEEGYPGTVECFVWYTAAMEGEKTVLEIEYQVELLGDECEETVCGVTNHSYFHVNPGMPTTEGTVITLGTDQFLELDQHQTPTGRIATFPLFPRPGNSFTLGATEPAIDDCFVIDNTAPQSCPLDTRSLPLRHLATISHPDTGLSLEIQSTEPAFQFYTGDGLYIPEAKTDKDIIISSRGKRSGIAIEPSRYVNCAGREEWRGMCRLRKGELWGAKSVYRGWKE